MHPMVPFQNNKASYACLRPLRVVVADIVLITIISTRYRCFKNKGYSSG